MTMMPSTYPRTRLRLLIILAVLIAGLFANHPAAAKTAPPQQSGAGDTSGIVRETMNAGGYTYVLVDSGPDKTWIAIPETQVKTGQRVQYSAGMAMENFHSKTLDRTFASIVFSPGLIGTPEPADARSKTKEASPESFAAAVKAETGPANATGSQAAPENEMTASGGSTGAVVPYTEVKVEKASGENSHTVAEIFAKAKDLNGSTVRLRAKVVKMNLNIMGRNWLHLQDGTGDPMSNSHDLVVTTAQTPANDQVITVEGKMVADKDFGAGYAYAAIIEDAKIIP